MVLETLHIINEQPNRSNMIDFLFGICPYILLDSQEYGRILLVHTNKKGIFSLETKHIIRYYKHFHCHKIMTCFPKLHTKLHKRLVRKLNIMYLDCDVAIEQEWDWENQTVTMTSD